MTRQLRRHFEPGSTSVLIGALLVVFVVWLQVATNPAGRWATLLDNTHWTFAYTTAALMVWFSLRGCESGEFVARRWIALGLSGLALGQWIWDLQVYVGWNPFPAPSDAAFLLPGLCLLACFAQVMRDRLPVARHRQAALDVTGFAVSALALVLSLYLPRGLESTALQMVVLSAYPILLLSAGAAALVMQFYLRLRWTLRWAAVLVGVIGQSVVWMTWNMATLEDSLAAGSYLNLEFSVLTLLLGWGASGWKLQEVNSTRFDRFCEGCIRQLPLAMVAMTATAIGLLVVDTRLPDLVRNLLLVPGLAAILFAAVRQTMQLGERDRLLEAERVVAESRAQLEYLAHHDALTGLPNLTVLRDRVQQAMVAADNSSQRVALLFIDLDQFKEVNDALGHGMGDLLLSHTARQLEAAVRQTDTVCRHGGDEFVVVLPGIQNIGDVVRVTDKLMDLASGSALLDGHELPMAMSIGVAFYPDDARNFDTLLQCSDTAMYKAKSSGRNTCLYYDSEMNMEAAGRMQMRGRLGRALERGELQLHYQPLVALPGGRVIGAEALLRWQQPELGMVSPTHFIPVAESSGLIVPIGAWVLREACRQAAQWRSAGVHELSIAVNLSVLQFRRGNLEEVVSEALRSSGLPAQCLELEITESVLMQDSDNVIAIMHRLRKLGVRLAIDDFGTGYSSLGYLKRLPASKLKIDKSLIHDAAIVRAVVAMARELGMTTVAEGVETTPQFHMLQACKCDQAQGYLFGRPMTADRFDELFRMDLDVTGRSRQAQPGTF